MIAAGGFWAKVLYTFIPISLVVCPTSTHGKISLNNSQSDATNQTPLLRVEELCVTDHSVSLLHNISFDLNAGDVIGVLGPNGAGKTTLFRCLFGAIDTYSGKISFRGEDLSGMSDRQRATKIAAVTQEIPTDFQLSVRSVIATGRSAHQHWLTGRDKNAATIINENVRLLHLSRYLDRDISQLSGGERKRVMICRALVQQPELLILDEPCNHLDIRHQHSLMHLLQRLPISCIVSLHDFPMAARYCNKVLVMDQGQLVAQGSPEKVFTPQLFESAFGVQATPYTNPWEQWSLYTTSLSDFSCTSSNNKERLNEAVNY
ncbi:MAG: ABC transporter ATP-binding protein [Amphritea sp.]|nr:ABC transporter ATP-binding protein [Amphritea sp.]